MAADGVTVKWSGLPIDYGRRFIVSVDLLGLDQRCGASIADASQLPAAVKILTQWASDKIGPLSGHDTAAG